MNVRRYAPGAAALALLLLTARPASAELIFFTGDRAMSVQSHRFDGESIVVTLRGGGEMIFSRALVSAIKPDEVPWDDPPAAVPPPHASAALLEHTPFDALIEQASSAHGLDVRLVKAVIQAESGYQPRARSDKGALGLMQLMPATGRRYTSRSLYDPRANIEAGARHLRTLLDQFDLPVALAAYNAGADAVRRFGGIPPFPETQAYVARVLALAGRAATLP